MLRHLFGAATAVALLIADPASAQSVHQEFYWRTPSMGVKINYALPAICDTATANAAATMNGMGVKFQLTGTTTHYTSQYVSADQDAGYVNIQPASGLGVIMRTQTYHYANPTPPREAIDALVLVNADRLYYVGDEVEQPTDLFCGHTLPAGGIGQRVDYQSAMTHEFGHVFGMGHRSDGSTGPCLMTQYLRAGEVKRSYCPDERSLMLGFYDAR